MAEDFLTRKEISDAFLESNTREDIDCFLLNRLRGSIQIDHALSAVMTCCIILKHDPDSIVVRERLKELSENSFERKVLRRLSEISGILLEGHLNEYFFDFFSTALQSGDAGGMAEANISSSIRIEAIAGKLRSRKLCLKLERSHPNSLVRFNCSLQR